MKNCHVGHLPREIAEIYYFFTKHDGQIIEEVMGHQVHCDKVYVLSRCIRGAIFANKRSLNEKS